MEQPQQQLGPQQLVQLEVGLVPGGPLGAGLGLLLVGCVDCPLIWFVVA